MQENKVAIELHITGTQHILIERALSDMLDKIQAQGDKYDTISDIQEILEALALVKGWE
jgi:hypothetical protein